EPEADDFFGEIMRWALFHPEVAEIVQSEQLALPVSNGSRAVSPADQAAVEAVMARLERISSPFMGRSGPEGRGGDVVSPALVHLSFSDLHQYELCPVRYRYRSVWQVPAPPDELLPSALQAQGGWAGGRAM